jgi:hypothetical protein
MTDRRIGMGFAVAALLVLSIQPVARADTGTNIVEEVDFATSCSPAVQHTFKHAVWTLHSFWYPEALKDFTAVTEAEPGCAIGYWGSADTTAGTSGSSRCPNSQSRSRGRLG